MIIELSSLPPAVQAWVATLPFDEDIRLTKSHDSLIIQEPLFDMARMRRAIDGYETKEQALQNGLTLPQGKNETELLAWLDKNIPTYLAKKGVS